MSRAWGPRELIPPSDVRPTAGRKFPDADLDTRKADISALLSRFRDFGISDFCLISGLLFVVCALELCNFDLASPCSKPIDSGFAQKEQSRILSKPIQQHQVAISVFQWVLLCIARISRFRPSAANAKPN